MCLHHLLSVIAILFAIATCSGQCTTFQDIANADEIQDAYSICRSYVKEEKFELAFPYWKTVYESAPALDGRINKVYPTGRQLYFQQFLNASDPSSKRACRTGYSAVQ